MNDHSKFHDGVMEQAKRSNQSDGQAFYGVEMAREVQPYRERSGWPLVWIGFGVFIAGLIGLALI